MVKVMTLLRRSAGVSMWGLVDAVAILAGLWVLFSNYSGLRTAFALSGLDMMPLVQDPLLGWVFEAFGLGEATQADLYAGAVAIAVGFGTFLLFHLLFRTIRLWNDRQDYLREGDLIRARMAHAALTSTLIVVGFLIPTLAFAFYWDFILFRFRVVAGVLEMDSPGQTWDLPAWAHLTEDAGESSALQLARIGAFGYLAVTACISLILEWAIHRTQEAWAGWEQALISLFTFNSDPRREEVSLRQMPGLIQVEAREGIASEAASVGAASVAEENMADRLDESPETPMVNASAAVDVSTPLDVPVRASAPIPRPAVHTPMVEDPEFEVIGGQPGERVKLSVALAQRDRYVVDSDRRRVWDRAHYVALHGESDSTVAEAA